MVRGYVEPVSGLAKHSKVLGCWAKCVNSWVAQRTLRSPLSVKLRLERITEGEARRRPLDSSQAFTIIVLVAKVGLAFGWADLSEFIAQFHSLKFVEKISSFLISGLDGYSYCGLLHY